MLDIYLIRHAESESNKNSKYVGGRTNSTPLSDRGKLQAQALAQRLFFENAVFDEVYSSTAERTQRTAQFVCNKLGFSLDKIVLSDDLLELSQGDWEGKPRVEVYTPETLASINSDNWNFKAPNGESQKEVEERMYSFIQIYLLPRYDKDLKVGIFGHGTAIKCLLRKIMDFTPKITYKMGIDNTSITQLRYTDRGWHPIRINDCAHLTELGKLKDFYC